MKDTQIEKCLELLRNNETQKLKEYLMGEYLKTEDKSKANLFSAVKKYLSIVDKCRPVLQTIMHQKGKQFICNGYSAYIFEKHITELEQLPNTTDETMCLNIYAIIKQLDYRKLNEDELIILKNIKKYITLYKETEMYKNQICKEKDRRISIWFNNKLFDTYMVEELTHFCLDIENLTITDTQSHEATQLKNDDITAIILPLRQTQEFLKETNDVKEFTEKFIKSIKDNQLK